MVPEKDSSGTLQPGFRGRESLGERETGRSVRDRATERLAEADQDQTLKPAQKDQKKEGDGEK
ncbi:hypothetical protein PRZ48_002417 [Zasmidium cellare]|uniref:Uncharacterized protein n=1 Tax=Zasmidium cellare TaxID=395010 RepID=A0ABR0F697_ZASCE|nr:hypothetical protein PRZ48_002417 [Zasmidium cellare]